MFDRKELFIIKMSLEDSIRWYKNKISCLLMMEKDGFDISTELKSNIHFMNRTESVLNEVVSLIS